MMPPFPFTFMINLKTLKPKDEEYNKMSNPLNLDLIPGPNYDIIYK